MIVQTRGKLIRQISCTSSCKLDISEPPDSYQISHLHEAKYRLWVHNNLASEWMDTRYENQHDLIENLPKYSLIGCWNDASRVCPYISCGRHEVHLKSIRQKPESYYKFAT